MKNKWEEKYQNLTKIKEDNEIEIANLNATIGELRNSKQELNVKITELEDELVKMNPNNQFNIAMKLEGVGKWRHEITQTKISTEDKEIMTQMVDKNMKTKRKRAKIRRGKSKANLSESESYTGHKDSSENKPSAVRKGYGIKTVINSNKFVRKLKGRISTKLNNLNSSALLEKKVNLLRNPQIIEDHQSLSSFKGSEIKAPSSARSYDNNYNDIMAPILVTGQDPKMATIPIG